MSYPPPGPGYPPQGQYNQQQGYGPPPGNYGQPPPPNQYGGYNQPPPNQYYNQGPPPNQYNQGPPPNQYNQGPPPNQGYNQGPPPPPHPNQYHNQQPPHNQSYGQYPGQYPPQQQQYGAPPPMQQQYGAPQHGGAPTPPSLGYVKGQVAPIDATMDADALRRAMKGFGTDEKELIRVLSRQDPLQMAQLHQTYNNRHKRDLVKDIRSETSSYFEKGLVAVIEGPLRHDVNLLRNAMKGIGTKENVLNDILIGRSNADMNAIKAEYQAVHRTSLESDLKSDLSMATEQMFTIIIQARRAEDSAPVVPHQTNADCEQLQSSSANKMGKNPLGFCELLCTRSDSQIRAIADTFHQRYGTPLKTHIKNQFSGHMEEALMLLVSRACDRAEAEATLLEDAMTGMGTKDDLLVGRIVRIHWDRNFLEAIKRVYQNKYRRDLITRVKGELSGDYERLMVALIHG